LLTYSKEKRRIDLITISSYDFITIKREPGFKKIFPFENQSANINQNNNINNNLNSMNNYVNINNTYSNLLTSSNTSNLPILNTTINYNNNNQQSNNINFQNNSLNNNNRPFLFGREKPIIFISARVHPGETPASFLMNGIIFFLLDEKDPRAEILRKLFVFKIIPIINVDGVSRGFYRYDTNSLNMNRHYFNPNHKLQPEISAIKRIFLSYAQENRIRYYYDLHAHASSRGLFLFGNNMDFLPQVENCILPKLIELNSEYLLFDNCNFSERSMKTKERGDKFSKEGTGRVHFHKTCEVLHCYTVEASYYRGLIKGILQEHNFELSKNKDLFTNHNMNQIHGNSILSDQTSYNFNEEKDTKLRIIEEIFLKFYNFNLKEFINNKLKDISSIEDSIKDKNNIKLPISNHNNLNPDDKSIAEYDFDYINIFYQNEECSKNTTNIHFSPNSISIKEKKIGKLFNISDNENLGEQVFFDTFSNLQQNKFNNNKKLDDNISRIKLENSSKIDYFNINIERLQKEIKIDKSIKNLLYENKFENNYDLINFPCFPDEETFHTPIAYQKMGISLLIAILDYEDLNPFTRLYNSDFKDVKGVRECVSKNLLFKDEKFRGNLLYSNLNKNIESFKKFNSLFDKYSNKNIRRKNNRFISKSNVINPINEEKKKNSTLNVPYINKKETIIEKPIEREFPKRHSKSEKFILVNSAKKEYKENENENFELKLGNTINKITIPPLRKIDETQPKGNKFFLFFIINSNRNFI